MRASLATRLRRLEMFAGGACPFCAGAPYATLRGEEPAPTCAACGRELPAVRIVRVDFYGNQARLDALKEDPSDGSF